MFIPKCLNSTVIFVMRLAVRFAVVWKHWL